MARFEGLGSKSLDPLTALEPLLKVDLDVPTLLASLVPKNALGRTRCPEGEILWEDTWAGVRGGERKCVVA